MDLTEGEGSVSPARVLVTGAYGLLGGWLVRGLLEGGAAVTVIRRDETPTSALVAMGLEPRVSVVHGDVVAEGLVARAIAEYEIDTVLHLAAQTLVPTANQAPLSTFETNVRGTWVTLEACRLSPSVQRVLVASSDKAYGPHTELPYTESHALNARFPYDASKVAADVIARSYWHTWQLPAAVTRFANLYGGGDFNLSRLVPETVLAVLSGRQPVVRSDGSPERDFLYVEDAVSAYLAIMAELGTRDRPGPAAGQAFNAGGGKPHRVLDVVRLICQLAGGRVEPDIRGVGTPAGEIDRQWVDYSKLRELTGWEPAVRLEDGLRRTLDWYRELGTEKT
jgi:CDP-glucose 4,6-dehydratase